MAEWKAWEVRSRLHSTCSSLQQLLQFLDGIHRPGYHAQRRTVQSGNRKLLAEQGTDPLFAESHREHRSALHLLHQPSARRHQPKPIFAAHHTCHYGSDEFSQAVPCHGLRLDPPLHPQSGHRQLGDEECRLRQSRFRQGLGGCRAVRIRRKKYCSQVEIQQRAAESPRIRRSAFDRQAPPGRARGPFLETARPGR